MQHISDQSLAIRVRKMRSFTTRIRPINGVFKKNNNLLTIITFFISPLIRTKPHCMLYVVYTLKTCFVCFVDLKLFQRRDSVFFYFLNWNQHFDTETLFSLFLCHFSLSRTENENNFANKLRFQWQVFVSCWKKSKGSRFRMTPQPQKSCWNLDDATNERTKERLTFCKVQMDWDHTLLKMQKLGRP